MGGDAAENSTDMNCGVSCFIGNVLLAAILLFN